MARLPPKLTSIDVIDVAAAKRALRLPATLDPTVEDELAPTGANA